MFFLYWGANGFTGLHTSSIYINIVWSLCILSIHKISTSIINISWLLYNVYCIHSELVFWCRSFFLYRMLIVDVVWLLCIYCWLVVSTLWTIWKSIGLIFPKISGKRKHVPIHQPVLSISYIYIYMYYIKYHIYHIYMYIYI